jgi:hypothetical protein
MAEKNVQKKEMSRYQDKVIGHKIEVDYKLDGIEQTEISVYVECPESLIHLKAVGHLSTPHSKEAQNFMSTLRCTKVSN